MAQKIASTLHKYYFGLPVLDSFCNLIAAAFIANWKGAKSFCFTLAVLWRYERGRYSYTVRINVLNIITFLYKLIRAKIICPPLRAWFQLRSLQDSLGTQSSSATYLKVIYLFSNYVDCTSTTVELWYDTLRFKIIISFEPQLMHCYNYKCNIIDRYKSTEQ